MSNHHKIVGMKSNKIETLTQFVIQSTTSIFIISILILQYSTKVHRINAFVLKGNFKHKSVSSGSTSIITSLTLPAFISYGSSSSSIKSLAPLAKDDINNIKYLNKNDEHPITLGICGGIGSGKSLCCKILSSNPNLFPNVIHCIDSDKVAHSIYDNGHDHGNEGNNEVLERIHMAFGDDVIMKEQQDMNNGDSDKDRISIDRKKLGQIVFSDENKMEELEKIVWPHVKAKIEDICNEAIKEYQKKQQENNNNTKTNTNPVIIIEGAVLIEAGWEFDAMWVISANANIQQTRLMNKRGLSSIDAIQRIEFQQRNRKKKLGIIYDENDDDGSGNDDEILLNNGIVNAVIENNGDDLDDLVTSLKKVWSDPNSWKK